MISKKITTQTLLIRCVGAAATAVLWSSAAHAAPCTAQREAKIYSLLRSPDPMWVRIDCDMDITLAPLETIERKNVVFEGSGASGATLDCRGGTIEAAWRQAIVVRSDTTRRASGCVKTTEPDGTTRCQECELDGNGFCTWNRPENVTIRDCNIIGQVTVRGWADFLSAADQTQSKLYGAQAVPSSKRTDYVTLARNASPRNVRFDGVHIDANGETVGFYVFAGTQITLTNSEIVGASVNGLYLDAETAGNVINDNKFFHDGSREFIAVDASENNSIIGNLFTAEPIGDPFHFLLNGGIYLYRNCGEGGKIRHTTPNNNVIVGNRFDYTSPPGTGPAIWVGSRNGVNGYTQYCPPDAYGSPGYENTPFGSSISDLDYAQNNAIMDNQVRQRSVEDAIQVGRPQDTDTNNLLAYNTNEGEPQDRPIGCYLPTGFRRSLIWHGGTVNVVQGSPATCVIKGCNDGVLTEQGSCSMQTVDFDCQAVNNDAGCTKRVYCPAGTALGVTAACDLENSWVSTQELATVATSHIQVFNGSDNTMEGLCYVANTGVREGETTVRGGNNMGSVWVGCSEHDTNGGDCHIRGKLYCQ